MTNRRNFVVAATAFVITPMFAASGRKIRTPLMLDAKRMAIHDGPGMRTTFFVKGCPLHCVWCHNPESISLDRQTARYQHLCQHCAKCTMDESAAAMGSDPMEEKCSQLLLRLQRQVSS